MAFAHKKSLGQNFLNNPRVPKVMADAGGVKRGDVVVEVGPGTGALTQELLAREAHVIAIEADPRAVSLLENDFEKQLASGQLKIIHADIKKFDLSTLSLAPHSYTVVANIPYFLSGFLFRFFLDTEIQPSTLVFLVQKEVAERIARDKKESLLSLSIKIFGDPEYIKTIKRGNFTPAPKVDSAIVAVSNISKRRLGSVDISLFFSVIHEGFKSKRKQLLGNLSQKFGREEVTHIFSTLHTPLDVRAEDVPLELWLKICKKIAEKRY